MAMTDTMNGGRSGAREVRVWDPLVRLIHWSLALTFLINSITEGDWAVHHWVGYAALGLVAIRLIWGLIGPRPARFSAFPPNPARALAHYRALRRGDRTVHLSHNPLGALMVYNIWATFVLLGVTGYMLGTARFFGVEWVELVHAGLHSWLVLSVVLHVGGVLFDTWRTGVPLVRAMWTGSKRIPDGAEVE